MASLRIDSKGVKHIKGSSANMFETVCGCCDTSDVYDDSQDGTPDCAGCILGAQSLLLYTTASEIKKWRLKLREES